MSINPFFWEFYAFLWSWLQVRGIVSLIFLVVFSINNYYINQNFDIELILGFDTSLDLKDPTIEPAKRPNCLIGRPGPPQTCCIEECTPNCRKDCTAKGFSAAGCYTSLGANFCCCVV